MPLYMIHNNNAI